MLTKGEMMSKYQEDLDKLFNFATHNDNGQKGVNDYILEELCQSKLNLEELVDKATPEKLLSGYQMVQWLVALGVMVLNTQKKDITTVIFVGKH